MELQWVAYSPSEGDPTTTPPFIPSPTSIRKDLDLLRRYFNGVILYGTGRETETILRLCRRFHMKAVLGLWGVAPEFHAERVQAIRLARQYSDVCVCLCAGNEVLLSGRATIDQLADCLAFIRRALPEVVLTFSEPVDAFGNSRLRQLDVDVLMPIVHPFFASITEPDRAVAYVREKVIALKQATGGRRGIFVKESGLPYKNHPQASPAKQAQFWAALPKALADLDNVHYAVFESFCLVWKRKSGPQVEDAWGIFQSAAQGRKPLPAVKLLPPIEKPERPKKPYKGGT